MASKARTCVDCGTDNVIHKNTREQDIDIVAVMLCSSCLHSRAQLQSMKEDKLPFPKLLAKIRSETNKRVHNEIKNSVVDAMTERYKGITRYSKLSKYWIDQIAYVQKDT